MNNTITSYVAPLKAEVTFKTCAEYSRELSEQIIDRVIPAMQRNGINPSLCLFADLQTRPMMSDTLNPYDNLMNVLEQFTGVVWGGYDATIRLEVAKKEIDRLNKLIDQLTQ